MTTLTELRKLKKQWLTDTLSENQLKKELKLKTDEIKKIPSETKYNKTHYLKTKVSWFLKLKDNLK